VDLNRGKTAPSRALLFTSSLLTFLLGILSEQISALHYKGADEICGAAIWKGVMPMDNGSAVCAGLVWLVVEPSETAGLLQRRSKAAGYI